MQVRKRECIKDEGIGSVSVKTVMKGKERTIYLRSVANLPDIILNRINISKESRSGLRTVVDDAVKDATTGIMYLVKMKTGEIAVLGTETRSGLYEAYATPINYTKHNTICLSAKADANIWNNILHNASYTVLHKSAGLVNVIQTKFPVREHKEPCSTYLPGKRYRHPQKI